MWFEIKQILINYKIQMFLLGLLVPAILVSVVYQMRYMVRSKTFRAGLMLSLSTIAVVPSLIAYLQFNSSLTQGDCVRHKAKFVTVKENGEEFTASLYYFVRAIDGERYELQSNDGSVVKVKFNRIDLDSGFEKLKSCPQSILK